MDKATTSLETISYARCFVEISANTPLKKYVWLETDREEKVKIDVEYEWVPPVCTKCACFGHLDIQCHSKEVWRVKNNNNTKIAKPAQKISVGLEVVTHTPEQMRTDMEGEEILEILAEHSLVANLREPSNVSTNILQPPLIETTCRSTLNSVSEKSSIGSATDISDTAQVQSLISEEEHVHEREHEPPGAIPAPLVVYQFSPNVGAFAQGQQPEDVSLPGTQSSDHQHERVSDDTFPDLITIPNPEWEEVLQSWAKAKEATVSKGKNIVHTSTNVPKRSLRSSNLSQ